MNFKNLYIYLPIISTLFACTRNEESADKSFPENPNILFIAIDDLRPEIGCYGNENIKSPTSTGWLNPERFLPTILCKCLPAAHRSTA